LQKYDHKPFIVCVVTPSKNHLLLANSSFLKKISHSSQELRVDNIKGTFLGTDICRQIGDIGNTPENFEVLFAIHQNFSFEENLERLVEATNNIIPRGRRFDVTNEQDRIRIMQSPERALAFSKSADYYDLLNDLDERTRKYQNEILIAAHIENVNLRGRIIEYIIAGESIELRTELIESLAKNRALPRLVTRDGIGDYTKIYPTYHTETDIKTKIMVLASAPKGYNVDKLLEFLSHDRTVFMIYLIGIDYEIKSVMTKLISLFQNTLLENTVIHSHWAGRNSRGTAQFNGKLVKQIILDENNIIDIDNSKRFLERILDF
jgi:hypothetical protein